MNIPTYEHRYVHAKIIKVKPGRDGTGYGGSLWCETVEEKKVETICLTSTTSVRRVKFLNEEGNLVKVPQEEGKDDWIMNYACLQEGEEGVFRKHLLRQAQETRESLDAHADNALNKTQAEGGLALKDALTFGASSSSKVRIGLIS